MSLSSQKTASILLTGNEILSGKVADQNASYLAGKLRALGVSLQRIVVLPDRVDCIAEEIVFSHPRFDLIFTSGGIGPTHDDVTLEGIAKGLGKGLLLNPALLDLLKKFYPDQDDAVFLKMISLPEGAELIYSKRLKVPVLLIQNIYVLPGTSEILAKQFEAVQERFIQSPYYLKKIFFTEDEVKIAAELTKITQQFPQLLFGSYPVFHLADYKVVVTIESKDLTDLTEGTKALLSSLPDYFIWKVE